MIFGLAGMQGRDNRAFDLPASSEPKLAVSLTQERHKGFGLH
jgi:hypothetical protein